MKNMWKHTEVDQGKCVDIKFNPTNDSLREILSSRENDGLLFLKGFIDQFTKPENDSVLPVLCRDFIM